MSQDITVEQCEKLFPDWTKYSLTYDMIVDAFGYQNPIWVEDDDFQGDSYALLKDGEKRGFLVFGWGSCSGCDWLQGCDTIEDITELYNHLLSEILWKDSAAEMLEYMNAKDWDVEWYARKPEWKDFLDKAKSYLSQ